ncbi:LysE family translocator [Novosphingobium panipatense]|uniref:Threonine/homoserine/homoserine lactone efflux protein n=1 Tax=Novosphingobium panipatense TaxID=428991 RepID=A0ABY1QI69_9SPHN|nr:LysE family translocator [Novosphingobium panipatense]SMP70070.1 Threonine/homoserine/homoserine lactone efflux protein [Novosphingobium panipatense]
MTLHTWWIFVAATFVISGTPGPNMLHVLARSVEMGARRSVVAMAGCLSAIFLLMAASAAGLTTLLLALPGSFEVLRYAGVAYLIYIGIRSWRAPIASAQPDDAPLPPALSNLALFRGGFAIAISNPKAILFAAAFFPQFIDPTRPQAPQFAILVGTFAVIETAWYCTYALGGRSLKRHLTKPAMKRLFNRVTGVFFIGFGLALLGAKRV